MAATCAARCFWTLISLMSERRVETIGASSAALGVRSDFGGLSLPTPSGGSGRQKAGSRVFFTNAFAKMQSATRLPPGFFNCVPNQVSHAGPRSLQQVPGIICPKLQPISPTHTMAQYVYSMNRVSKTVPPKRQLLKDISLSFFPGAKIGVLGLNGSGKSTLLKIMAGVDKEFEGEALPMPGMTIGYLEQEPKLNPEHTVRESVEESMGAVFAAKARLEEVYIAYGAEDADFDALAAEQAQLEAIIATAGTDSEHQLEIAADALRLPPWDAKIGLLSGGEKRRVALCRLLLSKPDMLLLDEPTNHLDAESVEWLEVFLQRFTGTVVAITHDRYFLDNAAEWILEMDRGRGIPWKGNYSTWLEQKGERLAQEQKSEEAHAKALKKELEWSRQNPKARQAKSKSRLARFEELSDMEYQKRNETQEIFIPVAERLGQQVFEFHNVSKSFGDRVLIDNLSFTVPPGAIVGIIGPNGAGKSTLFKMLAGKEKPDSGEVIIGQTVKMAFVDQHRDELASDKTVWEDISNGLDIINVGKFQMASRAYAGRFNFNGADQQKKVGTLSGGERGRLHLAKTLIAGGNVLLLDEPSNDLDVETLRALEDALLEFAGTVMVISHDRWFLDRIATHILAAEGDSQWTFFDGNYQEYEADKKKRLGEEGAKPKRMRYKALK
jgi:sulfate-transporting ATPase